MVRTASFNAKIPDRVFISQNLDTFRNIKPLGDKRSLYKLGGSLSKDLPYFKQQLMKLIEYNIDNKKNTKTLIALSAFYGITQILQDLIDFSVGSRENAEPLEKIFDLYYGEAKKTKSWRTLESYLKNEFKEVEEVLGQLKNAKTSSEIDMLTDQILGRPEEWTVMIIDAFLKDQGIKSSAFFGKNGGFITDNQYTSSNIIGKSISNVRGAFCNNPGLQAYLWAGFTGQTKRGFRTTFGRGGSDLTAIALGLILATRPILIKDEGKFFSADPKIVGDAARWIKDLHYGEAVHAGELGNPVMHLRALKIAEALERTIAIGNFETFRPLTNINNAKPHFTTFVTAEKNIYLCEYDVNSDYLNMAILGHVLRQRMISFREAKSSYSNRGIFVIPINHFDYAKKFVESLEIVPFKDGTTGAAGLVSIYSSHLDKLGAMETYGRATRKSGINVESDFQNPKPNIPAPHPQSITFAVKSGDVMKAQVAAHKEFVESNWGRNGKTG